MLIALLAMMLPLVQEVIASTHEPLPPAIYSERVTAQCGRHRIVVANIGVAYPLSTPPGITVDDKPVSGADIDKIVAFLGQQATVYRVSVQCPQTTAEPSFYVRVGSASGAPGDRVSYRLEVLTISAAGKLDLVADERTNADSFWYR